MAMSAPPAIAANRRSASSMGADKSESVNITTVTERLQHAVAHAVALAAIAGILDQSELRRLVRQCREPIAAVESVDPSLTTTTSAFQALARMQAITASSVAGMRALSLKAGITMLYFGNWATSTLPAHPDARTGFQGRLCIMHNPSGNDGLRIG